MARKRVVSTARRKRRRNDSSELIMRVLRRRSKRPVRFYIRHGSGKPSQISKEKDLRLAMQTLRAAADFAISMSDRARAREY